MPAPVVVAAPIPIPEIVIDGGAGGAVGRSEDEASEGDHDDQPGERAWSPERQRQEDLIVDFYQRNPHFYHKNHKDFKKTSDKCKQLDALVVELGGEWTRKFFFIISRL